MAFGVAMQGFIESLGAISKTEENRWKKCEQLQNVLINMLI